MLLHFLISFLSQVANEVRFSGKFDDSKNDDGQCLLIFENGSFRLERLHGHFKSLRSIHRAAVPDKATTLNSNNEPSIASSTSSNRNSARSKSAAIERKLKAQTSSGGIIRPKPKRKANDKENNHNNDGVDDDDDDHLDVPPPTSNKRARASSMGSQLSQEPQLPLTIASSSNICPICKELAKVSATSSAPQPLICDSCGKLTHLECTQYTVDTLPSEFKCVDCTASSRLILFIIVPLIISCSCISRLILFFGVVH
jgi:hypothetical protein